MADNKQEILFQLKIEENRALRALKDVKESVDSLDRRTRKYKDTVKEQVALEAKLASIRKQRIQINKGLEKSVKDLTKAQVQKKNAVGASTSATLELGRVLSDMPYGIRGVANNLQQLASNLFFMSKATDAATGKSVGFFGAIKKLLGGLIGPAGVLIAFQGVIALFDYFSNRVEKAEKKLDNYGGKIAKSASNLKILKQALSEGTLSTEEANKAVEKANTQYKDLNLKLGKNNKLTDDSVIAIDKRIAALERLSKAQAYQGLIEEEYSKIGAAKVKLEQELSEKNITIKQAEQKQAELALRLEGVGGRKRTQLRNKLATLEERNAIRLLETFQKLENKGTEAIASLMSTVTEEGLLSDLFEGKKTKGSKKSKFSPFKTQKELDLDVKNQENAIIKLNESLELQEVSNAEKTELLYAKTEEDKNDIKKRYAKKRLEIQYDAEKKSLELSRDTEIAVAKEKTKNHVAQLRRNFEEFQQKVNQKVALKELSQEDADSLLGKAAGEVFDKSVQADKELKSTVKGIIEAYNPLFSVFEELYDEKRDALGIGKSKDQLAQDLKVFTAYAEKFQKVLTHINDFSQAQFDRQLVTEQNKTTALNEQLNQRLLNENLSAAERKKIQNEIAKNDEALRLKQNEINKKKFNAQKAFNISMAVIDTAKAAAGVMAEAKGGFFARLAQAIPTIAFGLAQVATISRQKFQSQSATTPIRTSTAGGGSGGDGVGNRSFNFNLVGNTLGNQITDAIQGQFDQPLKAYVVSRDITSQQALDANIKGTASF